jgi:peptidoglycan-N-acetylglucosamine deacetylase
MADAESVSNGLLLKRIESAGSTLFLTFDDGPDKQHTPAVLDVLSSYGVPATFFCIGSHIEQHPDVLRRIVELGHTVGNHTWSHPYLTRVTPSEMAHEMERTSTIVEGIVGLRSKLMRPPYGDVNDTVLQQLWGMGYHVVMWDVDSVDWSGISGPEIVANVIPQLQPGSILLHHSAGQATGTADALPYIIETAQKLGYRFGSMAEYNGMNVYQG